MALAVAIRTRATTPAAPLTGGLAEEGVGAAADGGCAVPFTSISVPTNLHLAMWTGRVCRVILIGTVAASNAILSKFSLEEAGHLRSCNCGEGLGPFFRGTVGSSADTKVTRALSSRAGPIAKAVILSHFRGSLCIFGYRLVDFCGARSRARADLWRAEAVGACVCAKGRIRPVSHASIARWDRRGDGIWCCTLDIGWGYLTDRWTESMIACIAA